MLLFAACQQSIALLITCWLLSRVSISKRGHSPSREDICCSACDWTWCTWVNFLQSEYKLPYWKFNFAHARFCTADVFGGNNKVNVHLAWDAVGVPNDPSISPTLKQTTKKAPTRKPTARPSRKQTWKPQTGRPTPTTKQRSTRNRRSKASKKASKKGTMS